MITVVFCGGSGTRLWPLSTHERPKQLINLINGSSPIQVTYDRAERISSEVYLLPETRLLNPIAEQMPDIAKDKLIVEPGMRGTASCLVTALDVVARNHDHDEPIAFLSVDHHIRDTDGFAQSFEIAASLTQAQEQIVLVGVEPTYPATGFGYIQKSEQLSDSTAYTVADFKEKPSFDVAQEYVKSGNYLWNAGYFVASVNTFLKEMKSSSPDLYEEYQKLHSIKDVNSDEYHDAYLNFANNSIDYALIEKVKDLLVVPATFDWLDVGSFKDLHEANVSDEKSNYIKGNNVHTEEVENAYIRNDEDKHVAVIGLDNVTVVNTPDGILVARKDLSQKVGDIAKRIQADK